MNQITTALTPAQIAAIEAKQKPVAAEQAPFQAKARPTIKLASAGSRTKVVALAWPLELDGVLIEQIELRRLTGADFKALAGFQDSSDENAELLSLMSGLSPDVFNALDADDYANLSEEARDFLPQKLKAEIARISETGEHTPQ